MWNNKGFIFLEAIVSITVFFILGISSLTILQFETNQTSRTMQEWQAYWILQKTAERWKAGGLIQDEDTPVGFKIELRENQFSSRIQEGEFIIRWKVMGAENEKSGYAYRMALQSSSF